MHRLLGLLAIFSHVVGPFMSSGQHIEDSDIILIGSGIMSATLGAVLKNLQPDLKIQLYEVTAE